MRKRASVYKRGAVKVKGKTAIIDYGMGNLHSVSKALDYIGVPNYITGDAAEIKRADALILPGVGAFPKAMDALSATGLIEVISEEIEKKPLLGICLGMQLLFERGFEVEECKGLGVVGGEIRRIKTEYKLPQIGWNSLKIKNANQLTKGIDDGAYVYFVHSYCALAQSSADVTAVCDYGTEVCAMVQHGNAYGCQFHPEKSGETGLAILKNFGSLI